MPALTLREVLALDPVRATEPELLAGESALDRPVRWVHSSEVYEGANFLDGGELLLTNGFGLTDTDAEIRRRYVRELAARGASGLAVEIGRSLPTMPPEVTDEARRLNLPLLALHRVVPFVRITEAANRAIVARGLSGRSVVRPWGDDHTAALLADLADRAALNQPEVEARSALAGFHPGPGARLIGVSVHGARELTAVDRAVRLLGGASVLRAAFPADVLALLALPASVSGDPVRTVQEAFRTAADPGLTVAVGHAVEAGSGWLRWSDTLRAARTTLELALTVPAAEPAAPRGPVGDLGALPGPGARAHTRRHRHQPRPSRPPGPARPGPPPVLGGGPPQRPRPHARSPSTARLLADADGGAAAHRPPVPLPAPGTHRVPPRPGDRRPGPAGRTAGGGVRAPGGTGMGVAQVRGLRTVA